MEIHYGIIYQCSETKITMEGNGRRYGNIGINLLKGLKFFTLSVPMTYILSWAVGHAYPNGAYIIIIALLIIHNQI